MIRATMSVVPPATKGTTIVIGLAGQSWARADGGANKLPSSAKSAAMRSAAPTSLSITSPLEAKQGLGQDICLYFGRAAHDGERAPVQVARNKAQVLFLLGRQLQRLIERP